MAPLGHLLRRAIIAKKSSILLLKRSLWITPFLWSFLFLYISVWSVYNRCRLWKAMLLGDKNVWLHNMISFMVLKKYLFFMQFWLVVSLFILTSFTSFIQCFYISISADSFLITVYIFVIMLLCFFVTIMKKKRKKQVLQRNFPHRKFQKLVCICHDFFLY